MLLIFVFIAYQSSYTEEQNLLHMLLDNYTINARPVARANQPVQVDMFMEIVRIDAVVS